MAIVGHKTESIYRRYAIQDEAILREGAERLAAFHQAQDDARASAHGHGLGTVAGAKPGADQRKQLDWWAGTGLNRRHQDFQGARPSNVTPSPMRRPRGDAIERETVTLDPRNLVKDIDDQALRRLAEDNPHLAFARDAEGRFVVRPREG
jgi:hypothetical protein